MAKKINYFDWNKGSLLLLVSIGIFILLRILFEIFDNFYLDYTSLLFFILAYVGLISHLIFVGDRPLKKSWDFVKKSKNFIYLSLAIFIVSALIGFFVPIPEALQAQLMEMIKKLMETADGKNWFELIVFIFFNNSFSALNPIVFGIFLGIFPLLTTFMNGYFVGFVSNLAISEAGILSLWRLLPHGIFELPAIFISFGIGIRTGFSLFYEKESVKINFLESLRTFILIVIPLLIVAAIIEGTLIRFLS